jgi:WD40 repeat protein
MKDDREEISHSSHLLKLISASRCPRRSICGLGLPLLPFLFASYAGSIILAIAVTSFRDLTIGAKVATILHFYIGPLMMVLVGTNYSLFLLWRLLPHILGQRAEGTVRNLSRLEISFVVLSIVGNFMNGLFKAAPQFVSYLALEDGTARLWDVVMCVTFQTLKGNTAPVWAVVFSPDAKMVASGSKDSTVQLWNATTGAVSQMLKGHTSSVKRMAFSPDNKMVASESSNSTI